MTITNVVIEDTPDHTTTRTTDTLLKSVVDSTVYKPGSPMFNEQALQTASQAAIATLNTAESLLQGGGPAWDNATPAQRTALMLTLVRSNRALIRLALNVLDSPT